MGYDMWLTTGISDECYSRFADTYVSYNHSWAFYKYLNKERGIRWIYNKPMSFVVDGMNNVLDELVVINDNVIPTHPVDENGHYLWGDNLVRTIDDEYARDDGWAKTIFNAYRCAKEIRDKSEAHLNESVAWEGD